MSASQATHSHSHHHTHAERLEANKQFFDSEAHVRGYEARPGAQLAAEKCAAAALKAFPFDEDKTVAMDYACGVGLVSQALASHTKTLIGVDISSKSVDYFNERVANQGISSDEMKAVCVELKERGIEANALDGVEFDVIVCAAAYHHFDDIDLTTKILASYLKPRTGTLLVFDLIRSENTESMHKDHGHVVAHKGGFDDTTIRNAFVNAAGLQDFSFDVAFSMPMGGNSAEIFVAKGVRNH